MHIVAVNLQAVSLKFCLKHTGILVKPIVDRRITMGERNCLDALDNMHICVEEVCTAVDFIESMLAGNTSPVITHAHTIIIPIASCENSVFVKGVNNKRRAEGDLSGCGIVVAQEVIVILTNQCPTNTEHTIYAVAFALFIHKEASVFRLSGTYAILAEVIVITINLLNTGQLLAIYIVGVANPTARRKHTVNVDLSICPFAGKEFTAGALQHAVNKVVGMTGCGNSRAPINDGAAYFAISTAGVASLGAGCCLVIDGLSGMDMPAVPGCLISHTFLGRDHELLDSPSLGITVNLFTSKGLGSAVGQGYSTLLNADFHGDPPVLVLALKPCVGVFITFFKYTSATNLASNIVQLPNADRYGNQGLLTGQLGLTGLRDGQMQDLIGSIIGVSSRKALGHFHVIQFPLVHAVEVQSRSYRLNIGDVSSNNIHIIERTEENTIQRCIVRNDLHTGLLTRGNIHLANNGGIVALLIADGELDGMLACGENSAAIHSDRIVAVSAGNFVAVHIGLGGGCIDTGGVGLSGILRHHCGEVNRVVGNGSTICQGSGVGHAVSRIVHAREDWSFTIFHNGGIVHSDIINVDGEAAVDVGILLGIVVVRRAVTVRDVELYTVISITPHSTGIAAEITGQVVPAGLAKGINDTGAASGIIHDIASDGIAGNIYGSILVDRGDRIQYPAGPKANILVGNVNPHTKALCANQRAVAFLSLHRRTEQCGHHISGFLRIGVVNIDPQRIVTVVNLTIFRISNKRVAVRQVVIITAVSGLKATGCAVLKVEENLGPLAKRQGCFGSQIGTYKLRSNGGTGHTGRLVACRKAQAADRTGSLIRQREHEIGGIGHDFIQSVGCNHFQCGSLAVGNRNGIVAELDGIRNDHMDNGFTNHAALIYHLDYSITRGTIGGEHTIFNSAQRVICQLPGHRLRNFSGGACGADAYCGDVYNGAGGHIIALSSQNGCGKHIRRYCGGGNNEACGNGTLGTVRRPVNNRNRVGTSLTGSIGGGAAAVQVNSRNTACFQHNLSQLMHAAAAGERLLTAIENHGDNLAVSGNADTGTGVTICIIRTSRAGCHILTITDKPLGTGHSLPDGAVAFLIHIVAKIGSIVNDSSLAIVQDCEEVVIAACAKGHTVNVGNAHGLTGGHVVEGCVDAGNNIIVVADVLRIVRIAVLLVGIRNLVCQFFHAQHTILMLVQISSLNNHIITGNISRCHIVYHLLAVLRISIANVLCYAGRNRGSRTGKHIVSFRDKLVTGGNSFHGKRCNRHRTEYHYSNQQKRQQSSCFRIEHK